MAARGGEQRFLRALSGYRKVNLDTNPIVYYFGGGEPYGRLMKALFGLVDRGSLQVVISRIVQMELLVKPIRDGDLDAVGEVIHFTESTPNVRVEDVSQLIVVQAAFVRADSLDVRDKGRDKNRAADDCKCEDKGLVVPDCLVVATGIVEGCDATITNDRRWRQTLKRLALRPPMAHGPVYLNLPPTLYLHEYVDS